ncbi:MULTISPECIES: hypothetical protein [Streptomyces]|uniref:hypothetical protein n=1 Tax=Streptomyces TaxID=1883 RepID=UPI0013154291|nr:MULTISPECIES: hypothetical protein [Streptomyces]
MRCGVTGLGPTVDPCFAAEGVDWVVDTARSSDNKKVIVTYGRPRPPRSPSPTP